MGVIDPFKIVGPAVINFSSGKSSARLLRECQERGLDDDVFVSFENTSKERVESLDFAHEIETQWSVPVVWLERAPLADKTAMATDHLWSIGAIDESTARRALTFCFRIVDYATAARDGSVFEQLISERDYLPNPITRYCTTEMKTLTVERWMRSRGFDHWTEVLGLRADEPDRVANQRAGNGRKYREVICPLADAGITKPDVDAWWREQPFQLQLRPWEGNCDLCHLKGIAKIKRIMRDRPDLAEWWIRMENVQRPRAKLPTFRNDRPAYAALLDLVQAAKAAQPMFGFADDEPEPASGLDDLGDCFCPGAT